MRRILALTKAQEGIIRAAVRNWNEDEHENHRQATVEAIYRQLDDGKHTRPERDAIIQKALSFTRAKK